MTDKYKTALDDLQTCKNLEAIDRLEYMAERGKWAYKHDDTLQSALTLATEAEQLRKRLAELETLIEQANKKIQWYERTEATND